MSEPANFELAEQKQQEAIQAARDSGVDEETISNFSNLTPESQSMPQGEVQDATEVTQDVPVGSEFSMDFSNMSAEQEVEDSPVDAAFQQSVPITNPYIKQIVGEEVNDPVIFNQKLNKVTAYEMKLNGSDFQTARTRAEAALQQSDMESVMQGYKSQVAEQMELDWKEYIQTASPEEIVARHEFLKEHSLAEAYEGKLGDEKLFADTFASLTLDEEREANTIVQGYANQLLAERVDEVGTGDWILSGAGLFLPDYLKDTGDLMDSGLFSTKEKYFNFIEGFKESTPDQKARILDLYVPKVWEAFEGNPIKAAGAINILFDESHETSFWIDAGFDLADFTGIGFDVFKLGAGGYAAAKLLRGARSSKRLNSISNIKMKYRDVDNPSAATEVTAASKADETGTVQKGNNQSEQDEALDVSAASTEKNPLSDNSVDGLADAHTRLYEQVKYNKTSSPFQQNYLSQLEKTRLQGMERGVGALVKRHTSNIKKIKADLVKEGRPLMRTIDPKAWDETSDITQNLMLNGWRVYNRTEDSVTIVKATEKAARLQRELVKESTKLEKASTQLDEISNQIRYGNATATTPDDAMAIARGEIPKGAEDYVQAEAANLRNTYKALSDNAAEAIAAGLDPSTANKIVQSIRENMDKMTNTLDQIMPEMLEGAEKAAIEKATIEKIQNAANDSGKVIKNIEITDRDRKGFKAKITYEQGSDVEEVRFTENDIGDLGVEVDDIKANLVHSWGSKIFSPEHQFDAADNTGRFGGLVRDPTFAGDQTARIKRALNRMAKDAIAGLSRKKKDQLDRLVLASDDASAETGRLFTVKELTTGVDTVKGTEIIPEDVIESYFKMHLFLGETKRMMDWATRRSLEVKGFKNLNFMEKGTLRQSIVKPVKNWGAVDFTQKQKVMMYDEASETWGTMDAATLVTQQDRLKDEGYQLVEFFNKEADTAGNVTSHGLIPPDPRVSQVGHLPQSVLNNTKGMYIPRVYNAGYHYVRDLGDARKPTVLAFERKTDAERYVKRKNEEGKNYQRFQDGDMGYEDSILTLSQGYGGLYTSARKRENLKMVAAGKDPETELTRPERLGGISSVQRYLDATGNMMPMAEQRIAAVRRFENQLDKVAKSFGNPRGLETPGDFNSRIMLPDGSPEKALFERMRENIKGSYGQMNSQERAWQGMMTSIAEYMEKGYDYPIIGGVTESARKFAVDMANMDVRGKLLGATFDAHLGWFNPSQLYVQAQNAALAASMHPAYAAKAIPQAFAARAMIHTSQDSTIGEISEIVGKGIVPKTEEFIDTVRAFRKSGLYDSVMRVADYGGKASGFGGTAMDKFRTAARAGRLAYEEGETFSRIVSFFIAKDMLKSRMGKKFDLKSDETVKMLSDETYRIMMNMQKENGAWWQNNWLGIPLQFMQVQAKLIENILPAAFGGSKRWTAKEKMSVLTGQLILYGAVGVPMVQGMSNYMMDFLGVEPTDLKEDNPQALEFMQEGVTGVLSQALGFDNNFSDRGSILKGLDDNAPAKLVKGIYRTLRYGDDEMQASDYLGASLNTVMRTKDAGMQLVRSVNNLFYKPTGKVAGQELMKVGDAFASITSTWSNAQKAKYLHESGLQSKNGNLMMPSSEFDSANYQSWVARIWGFPYDKEVAFYNTFEAQKSYQRDWKYVRQSVKRLMMEQMRNPMDEDVYRKNLMQMTMTLNEYELDKMYSQILDETISGQNALDKQMNQQLRLFMSGSLERTPVQGIE